LISNSGRKNRNAPTREGLKKDLKESALAIAEPVRQVAEPRPMAAPIRGKRKAKPDHPWRLGYEMRMAPRPLLAAPPVVLRPSASP
jgi:hypothetical protein